MIPKRARCGRYKRARVVSAFAGIDRSVAPRLEYKTQPIDLETFKRAVALTLRPPKHIKPRITRQLADALERLGCGLGSYDVIG